MHVERFGAVRGARVFAALHGWSGDHRTFEPVYRRLPGDVTFLAADLPGCGNSPPPRAWTVGAIADEIADWLQTLECPVTLVGNCSGANFAMFAALRVPERGAERSVARIVAIDAFAFWPWYLRVFVHPVIGRYAYFSTFANPIGRALTNLSLSAKRAKETSLTDGFSRVDHETTFRYLEVLRDAGGIEAFRALQMPVDFAYGDKSFDAVRESARRFVNLLPHARAVVLPGAGHLPIQEATGALCRLLFETDTTQRKEPLCPTLNAHIAS
jgi:pimeloyl-ACP methyl ester carboxylesterase